MKDFKSTYTGLSFLKDQIVRRLFLKQVKKNKQNFFLRTNDIISVDPTLFDIHERHLVELYIHSSKIGYSDFFLDIGANVGLSSASVESFFDRIIAIEPNPHIFKILTVNFGINVPEDKYTLENFALADTNGNFKLRIPKHNWGGAYIVDENNSYTKETLAKKDGFNKFEEDNYLDVNIEAKNGAEYFSTIFNEFKIKNKRKGFIKIDVEGFEKLVIKQIAESIPKNFSAIIVFENWSNEISLSEIKDFFKDFKVRFYNYERTGPFNRNDGRLMKIFKFFFLFFLGRSNFIFKLKEEENFKVGDCIIKIN